MNGLELREQSDGSLLFSGLAAATEHSYEVGFFTETIATGAFKRSLNNENLDVKFLLSHGDGGSGLPLADTVTRTLRLRENHAGLLAEADLDPRDSDVALLASKMRRGLVREMSIGFRATEQQWSDDRTRRRVLQVEMHRGDVSVVSFGANEATTATLRADDLPLEERARRVGMIGDRLRVTTGGVLLPASPNEPDRRAPVARGAWDGSPSRFTSKQWATSCVLDRKACGGRWADAPPKTRCSLPIREPDGRINARAVHAAAARIGQVTDACAGALAAARSRLRTAYSALGETPPDSIKRAAIEPERQTRSTRPNARLTIARARAAQLESQYRLMRMRPR